MKIQKEITKALGAITSVGRLRRAIENYDDNTTIAYPNMYLPVLNEVVLKHEQDEFFLLEFRDGGDDEAMQEVLRRKNEKKSAIIAKLLEHGFTINVTKTCIKVFAIGDENLQDFEILTESKGAKSFEIKVVNKALVNYAKWNKFLKDYNSILENRF